MRFPFEIAGLGQAARLSMAIACLGLALAGPAEAQSAVKVLVNDQPITTYDVSNRARFLQLTTRGQAGEKQAMEELIDERLKEQEARRRNVSIPVSAIEEAFAGIASRAQLAPAQLEQALAQEGVNPETLKSRISAELAWAEVLRARFRATVRITDQDVANALAGNPEAQQAPALQQYDVQPIIFVVPENASQALLAQRKREAEAFRSRFASCDQALQQAKGLRDVVVRATVRRDESQLDSTARDVLAKTAVGSTTPVEQVQEGFQVLAVCGKRALEGQTTGTEEVRTELLNERGQLMARRYLRDLRSDAVIEYR